MRPLFFLNRYAWPDDSATAQLLSDLCEDQARRGRKVTVLTSRQLYRDAGAKLPAEESHEGVFLHRLWSTAFGRDRLWGRAIDYLTFYVSVFLYLLFRLPRNAVLVTLTDPPLTTVIAFLPAVLKKLRQVHWSQDVFPEIIEAVQRPSRPVGFAVDAIRRIRNLSLRPKVQLAVIGEDMRDHFVAEGVPADRISILPNWSSGDQVFPVAAAANELRQSWGLADRFVLGYSGNLGRVHDYHTFLEGAEILIGTVPGIRFLFIGSGALQRKLKDELPASLRDYTVFQPYQDRELLSQSLSVPDLHWISLQPGCTPFVFPSKFYGVIAAGRPSLFIGQPQSELGRFVVEEQIGACVAQGDGTGLARAIESLAEKPEERLAMGQRARSLFLEKFDRPIALDRWDALLKPLAQQ